MAVFLFLIAINSDAAAARLKILENNTMGLRVDYAIRKSPANKEDRMSRNMSGGDTDQYRNDNRDRDSAKRSVFIFNINNI